MDFVAFAPDGAMWQALVVIRPTNLPSLEVTGTNPLP